jgi:hypothetical protein
MPLEGEDLEALGRVNWSGQETERDRDHSQPDFDLYY